MLTVCCFLWADPQGKCNAVYRYGREHVAALARMVRRHLTMPHEFVCVTDEPEALAGVCRTVPLDVRTILARAATCSRP